MVATNEVTGDKLVSKLGNKKAFDDGYDRIFGKDARERLRNVEEREHGPCQLHDACAEKSCQCMPS